MRTTGREMHLVKQIGEYLVCAELGRRGYIATSFTGNVPEFDILAIDKERRVQPIQVKAIRQGQWQFNASHFADITLTIDGRQIVGEKKRLANPDLICVFVRVVAQGKDEFYIFRLGTLQDIIVDRHCQWLDRHGGRRPRSPESMHTSVRTDDLAKYRDDWDLLSEAQQMNRTPYIPPNSNL